jgi:uncharacterized protein (DUF1778 family)
MARSNASRDVVINLRASAGARELIDRAAAALGQSRSEFMLDSARRRAEDVLLDRKLFLLDEERYQAFLEVLNNPPAPSKRLKALLGGKSPWER